MLRHYTTCQQCKATNTEQCEKTYLNGKCQLALPTHLRKYK